jgi:ABC-2 type transport system ATP-binding protein
VNVIEVEGVCKSFRIPKTRRHTIREHLFGIFERREFDDLHVLRDLSFTVRRGESLGIMGRNGSGKSTLLRILSNIYQPDRGRVSVHAPITPILALGVGWNQELTARDNLYLTGTAMGLSLKELDAQFDEIIAFAGLERFVDLQLKFYSSGMSSRLAYAIAFRAVREVLLLDEVFAVGDVGFTERCRQRFVELHQAGHTMVLVSHDPATIAQNCQRALLLDDGHIIADGDPREVANQYSHLLLDPSPRAA